MAELPELKLTPTIDAIYQLYVDEPNDWRRDHLGGSQIGKECERALWYDFRWCTAPNFDGRMLRLFKTGNREEKRILDELARLKLEIYVCDHRNGKQIHYDDFGGHFGLNLDAMARGFKEAPKTWHVVECKTMNTANFARFKKSGVMVSHFKYWAQMQAYMAYSKKDRAFFIAVCKDTDELWEERVYFDPNFAKKLRARAEQAIFGEKPSFQISDNDNHPECKWCDHKGVCRGKECAEITCRTCFWAKPTREGGWACEERPNMSSSDQRHPCALHLLMPCLVPMETSNIDIENGTISYGAVINGPGHTASENLWKELFG